ncbi:MAG: class I SAM-dependent methyltransferase [Alphaproteobacteria bacterium]
MTRQHWNPDSYEKNAGFVADLGAGVVDLLAPEAGERILDIGCGHGKLTVQIERHGCDVVGIDASAEQVAGACDLGLDARVMDASRLEFDNEFDAVFSNAALHWIMDADSVIRGVEKALKAGGRFVAEFGGSGNVAAIAGALVQVLESRGVSIADVWPWYFPTVDDYRAKLQAAGFTVDEIFTFERPTPIPGDIDGWLDTFCESFLKPVPENQRPAFVDDVRDLLAPTLRDGDGNWTVDYVRLRFKAHKGARP